MQLKVRASSKPSQSTRIIITYGTDKCFIQNMQHSVYNIIYVSFLSLKLIYQIKNV